MQSLTSQAITQLFERFRSLRLCVIGDLILDEYLDSKVDRISPEAPVPVVHVQRTFFRAGGAANVASCIAALGGRVTLAGAVGNDASADELMRTCESHGIGVGGVLRLDDRATIRKMRVISHNQQLMRMDWETIAPISSAASSRIMSRLRDGEPPDVLVISDYAKGLLTDELLGALFEYARERKLRVLVDPKAKEFGRYRGASIITPNLRELQVAAGRDLHADDLDGIAAAADTIARANALEAMVVTLGERGMLVVSRDGQRTAISSVAREVFDVTGAGDTVIGVLALGLAAGMDLAGAAMVANAAAGVAVSKLGTAVVRVEELAAAIAPNAAGKLHSLDAIRERANLWRLQGKRIAFTNGCYDLLHAGHLSLLRAAAAEADVLVIGVNSDASVTRLKGPKRPLIAGPERAELLAALNCVDAVVIFEEDTPLRLIEAVRPDVLVKGADYAIDQVVGRELVESYGGRVFLAPLVPDRSTSGLVDRILADKRRQP